VGVEQGCQQGRVDLVDLGDVEDHQADAVHDESAQAPAQCSQSAAQVGLRQRDNGFL
jgi:hypothetical protein